MNQIQINNDIIHTENIIQELKPILAKYNKEKIYLLTDDNCYKYCLPVISEVLPKSLRVITIENGEKHKNYKTLQLIWDFLVKNDADRDSLLINLGGGVITDIGGFAASTFKRGMRFINIPTSLLAQVDASIGGKTGINYLGLKNEIGVINQAEKVLISSVFLNTLEKSEFLSGFSEMIKHALINNKKHLEELKSYYLNHFKTDKIDRIHELIVKSVNIKEHFIKNDLNDKGIRQTLNFGHTFGHVFESYFNEKQEGKIKHGEAVAFGMICELYLSVKKLNFPKTELNRISLFINTIYGKLNIPPKDFNNIFNYMLHDKKNSSGKINCVLLKETGNAVINNRISKEEMIDALSFLNKNTF